MEEQANQGIFLSLEGIEGVGKSTAVKYIQRYLTENSQEFVVTREPGGTLIAEQIRQLLLTPNSEAMASETELLLMFASRAQHLAKLIIPALNAGKWVICDRFVDASYAYQGGGRTIDEKQIEELEKWVVGSWKPTATILLDAPPKVGLARAKNRGAQDRIEQERVDFFERVRETYLQRAKQDSKRFYIIDATQSLSAVQEEIKKLLDRLIADKKSDK